MNDSFLAYYIFQLDQLSARGVNSMLVTVDHVGDISIHGSQKGQLFLKDNTDIAERFAKVCSGKNSQAFLFLQNTTDFLYT